MRISIFLLTSALLLSSGCSSLGAKAWEKNLLARDDMLMDADALDLALDEHTLFRVRPASTDLAPGTPRPFPGAVRQPIRSALG